MYICTVYRGLFQSAACSDLRNTHVQNGDCDLKVASGSWFGDSHGSASVPKLFSREATLNKSLREGIQLFDVALHETLPISGA